MYIVSIKTSPAGSSVEVSRLQDLEQAISFGFQLHNVSTSRHYIVVQDGDDVVASFVRQNPYVLPATKNEEKPQEQRNVFGLKRRDK